MQYFKIFVLTSDRIETVFTVYPLITILGNYCFDLPLEGVINRGRVIIRGLKFERVLGHLFGGNYCFELSLDGVINGSGVII